MSNDFDIYRLGWESLKSKMIEETTKRIALELANQIDDIIAGLMINGVTDINIQHYPDRVVIVANGEAKYEIRYGLKENANG